jgi:competence protein ComEC
VRKLSLLVFVLLATNCTAAPKRDVIISRVMVDPTAVSDERGEWIEIANLEPDSVDLHGWQLRSAHDPGFVIPQSLVVPAGGTVVLGRNADSTINGGVAVSLAYSGITLGNSGDWIVLRDASGVTADSVEWTKAPAGEAIDHRTRHVARAVTDTTTPKHDSPAPPNDKSLVVRVLDVGQGDAIFIQNGASNVLIDGGPTPRALGAHLDALHLNGGTIDAVILTHAHADHYQGLRELFASRRHISVRYFWENQDPSSNVTLAKLRDSIAARVRAGTLVYRNTDDPCANGTPLCTVTLKGGAKIHIMRPMPSDGNPNDRSPAIKLVGPDSASFTMWLAGDAERAETDWFAQQGYQRAPGMHVDVLKADHHGSCNGVSDAYLDLLSPSLVVASVGAVNDYGHMHAQAKAMFEKHGIPWYRTDQNGTITLRSAGTSGSKYTVTVERGEKNLSGPSDRQASKLGCTGEP